jgi:hypothetical protein
VPRAANPYKIAADIRVLLNKLVDHHRSGVVTPMSVTLVSACIVLEGVLGLMYPETSKYNSKR